jgi:hypothetical protein
MYIKEGDNIYSFIIKKYGLFSLDALHTFLRKDLYTTTDKLSDKDIGDVICELYKLIVHQNLSYKDLVLCGTGQTYKVIQVGDAVVKIGHKMIKDDKPYRLSPVYEKELNESKKYLYVSQRANGRKVSYEEMLDFYSKVKEEGSIWLDPKQNNLGHVDHFLDFTNLYGTTFKNTNEGIYLLDYEDIITLTDDNREELIDHYGADEDKEVLRNEKDTQAFYHKLFIDKRRNLLEVEKQIALRCGYFEYARWCDIRQQRIFADSTFGFNYNGELSDKYIKEENKMRIVSAINKFKEKIEHKKTPRR